MTARLEAESKHPKPDDGKILEFPAGMSPLVRVGEVYGRAIRFTRTYGLVEWADEQREYQVCLDPWCSDQAVDQASWRGRLVL